MKFIDIETGEVVATLSKRRIFVNTRFVSLLALNNCWPETNKLDACVLRWLASYEGGPVLQLTNSRRLRREFLRWVNSEKWIEEVR